MIEPGVSRDALTDRVYEMLRTQIIQRRLAPNERLLMGRLSADLGVSHTPIREALNRLASERLVSLEPYRGFRVTPLLDPMGMRQLFEARLVIEQGCLDYALAGMDEDTLEELAQLCDKLDGLASAAELDVVAFNELDAAFHRRMVAAGGNGFLLNAFDDLRIHAQIARHYQGRSVEEARQAQAEHRVILESLLRGDREAVLAQAATHISNVLTRLQDEDADGASLGGSQ